MGDRIQIEYFSKECGSCQRMFAPTDLDQKFCSERCSKRESNRRNRQNRKGSFNQRKRRRAMKLPPETKAWHIEEIVEEIGLGGIFLRFRVCNDHNTGYIYNDFGNAEYVWRELTKAHAIANRVSRNEV